MPLVRAALHEQEPPDSKSGGACHQVPVEQQLTSDLKGRGALFGARQQADDMDLASWVKACPVPLSLEFRAGIVAMINAVKRPSRDDCGSHKRTMVDDDVPKIR